MKPKVTVLMTVFNGERYLKDCIDSVLNQTFKDFEFLIIDDCSIDSSRDIIKSYKDKRIFLIENQKNLSQVKSLNIGLEEAAGEYLARIDQDDLMMENRLERQLDFLDKRPEIAVAGTWGEVIDENGKVSGRTRMPVRNEEILGSALFCGYFLMHPSVMFRKDLVAASGKYDESLSLAEDFDLWMRLLLKKYKLANIPEFLTKFRYHRKSSSRRFPEAQSNSVRGSISNFISNINGAHRGSDLDRLCDILINAGLMRREYWLNSANTVHIKEAVDLMEKLLKKTADHFNFKKKEIYSMKRIFCNRMLNFAYSSYGSAKKKSLPLYLFCIRNYPFLYTRPKLYMYPLKIAL